MSENPHWWYNKRGELSRLFGCDVFVNSETWGRGIDRQVVWTVQLHHLTEEQVRQLAEYWRVQPKTKIRWGRAEGASEA